MNEVKNTKKNSTGILSILLLAVLSIIWGSSFILIKKSLIAFSPVQVFGFRIGVAGLAFFPFFRKEIKKLKREHLKYLIVVGLFGSGFPALLYAIGQQHVNSSVAGLLNSLTPLFTLILGLLFFQTKIEWLKILGVVSGLIGASLLVYFDESTSSASNIYFALLLVLATCCYAISLNTVGKFLHEYSAITISSIAFGLITIPAIAILLSTDVITVFRTHEYAWNSLLAVSILSLLGTFAANILFYKLVQMTNALFSSMVSYLIPIVAIFWGLMDGELITVFHLVGFAFILLGVYLSKTKKEKI